MTLNDVMQQQAEAAALLRAVMNRDPVALKTYNVPDEQQAAITLEDQQAAACKLLASGNALLVALGKQAEAEARAAAEAAKVKKQTAVLTPVATFQTRTTTAAKG